MNTPNTTVTDHSTHRFHESASAQVQGRASYIDDLPLVEGTLHAAPLMSPLANAQLIAMDVQAVLAAHGVVGV
jgi:xanthine dehydrogenase large subunit